MKITFDCEGDAKTDENMGFPGWDLCWSGIVSWSLLYQWDNLFTILNIYYYSAHRVPNVCKVLLGVKGVGRGLRKFKELSEHRCRGEAICRFK